MKKLLILFFLSTAYIFPQEYILKTIPPYNGDFNLQFTRPVIRDHDNYFFYTGIYDLSTRISLVPDRFYLSASMPFSLYHSERISSSVLPGNLQMGVEFFELFEDNHLVTFAFDLYLPNTRSDLKEYYMLNIFANPFMAYKHFNNTTSIVFNAIDQWYINEYFSLRSDLGFGALWNFKGDLFNTSFNLHYGLGFDFTYSDFVFTSEIVGTSQLYHYFDFYGSLLDSYVFGFSYQIDRYKPGVFALFSLDNNRAIDDSFGFNFSYGFDSFSGNE